MFCMEAHQLYIDLPYKSRMVQLLIHTCYNEDLFFSLMLRAIFSKRTYCWSIALFRCNDFFRSLYYFLSIPKPLIAQHYSCLIYI
jgi:hypothetical protein